MKDEAWGGLKAVGSNILKSLTVPQAALYTSTAKLTGKDTSWKNAFGDFRVADNGMRGTDAALNALGVTNKWARLGVSIVVDPLWFVGGALVRAPSKAAAIQKAASAGADVGSATKVLQLTAGGGRTRQLGSGVAPVNWTKGTARRGSKGMLGSGRKQLGAGSNDPLSPRVRKALDKITDDMASPREMRVPGLPKSFPRVKDAIRMPAVNIRRQVKINLKGRQKTATGDLIDNRFFVTKAPRGKGYRIYDLGRKFDPDAPPSLTTMYKGKKVRRTPESVKGQLPLADSSTLVSKTFSTADEAFAEAERIARQAGHSGAARGSRQKRSWAVAQRDDRPGMPTDQRAKNADPNSGEGWTRSGQPYDPDYETNVTDMVLRGDGGPKAVQKADDLADDVVDSTWDEMEEAVNTAADALRAAGNPEGAARIIDEYGNATDLPNMLKKLREELTKVETREGMNYGVKVGAGKFSKTFDTGISAERGFLGRRTKTAFRAGMMGMKPIEKVAHALRRSGSETSEGVTAAILRMADSHGMTQLVGGKKVIKEADATMIGVYRSARSVNEEMGETVKAMLQKEGRWTKAHDDVVAEIDKRNDYFQTTDNLKADERLPEKQKAVDEAEKKLAKAQKAFDANETKATNRALQQAKTRLEKAEQELTLLKERGAYTKQGRRQEDLLKEQKLRNEAILQGRQTGGFKYRRFKDPDTRLAERTWLDNPFHAVTPEEFVADMQKVGLDEDTARSLMNTIASELNRKGLNNFRESSFKHGLPEWNAFLLAGRREQDHIWAQVEAQIDELMRVSGISEDSGIGTLLKYGVNREDGSTISGSPFGQMMLKSIAKFKGFLTFANPSHFTRNLAGDYVNSMINGGFRHANPMSPLRAGATRSRNSRLANAENWAAEGKIDDEILKEIFVVGGKEYTGLEFLAMSRMVGLGRGYVGTDVALMAEAFERARTTPGEFYKFMQRLNIKRENAQRVQTWMNHMNNGDDFITASVKTLRVHFDYTQLTEFEKLTLRNVLLFYTWMKRNLILQTTSLATRPGYMGTMADLDRGREHFPNEPEYYKHQGAIPIPGFGNITFGNPAADLMKQEIGLEAFRRDIMGAITPPIRLPAELASNQKYFSGGRIQDYEGEKTQSVVADFARALGIPVGTLTTAKAGGESSYGINPQLAYLISQLTGPQGGTVQSLSKADYEGSKVQEGLGRFVGIAPQQNRPEQFARAAKYLSAKKKADATRARNAQRGN